MKNPRKYTVFVEGGYDVIMLCVSDSSGESDTSEDSDIDGEAASALFMVVCVCVRVLVCVWSLFVVPLFNVNPTFSFSQRWSLDIVFLIWVTVPKIWGFSKSLEQDW